jgi:2-polyprenyl-3-methyl-5-hydroxy-6-metoxy-1,4-benzoquinol methylase
MAVEASTREEPQRVLQEMEVHEQWISHFRSSENDAFYNLAFDYIAHQLGAPAGKIILDAGCGSGTKSLHLARRGYKVLGLDLSESMLATARSVLAAEGREALVEFRCADITRMPIANGSVTHAACWGVLMHVPDVAAAISELSRAVGSDGCVVISEGNKNSVQAWALRVLKRTLGKERAEVLHTPAGIEFWEQTHSGRFMTRQADMNWVVREFERHGLKLVERRSGQLTEMYTLLPWHWARRAVHALNNFWFKNIHSAGPAFGNILVFRREVSL